MQKSSELMILRVVQDPYSCSGHFKLKNDLDQHDILNFSFGRSWPGLFIFIGFFTYLIQNSIAIFGDGGVMEKCHAVQAELAKSEKKKLEVQNDKHQSSNLLYQKRTEIEHTNNEINSITKAISELKNWETEMENYFANVLRTQLRQVFTF